MGARRDDEGRNDGEGGDGLFGVLHCHVLLILVIPMC